MTEIDSKLVERMVALVRDVANIDAWSRRGAASMRDEARAIVAELPEPVDPDLALAREVAQDCSDTVTTDFINGDADESWSIKLALAAIKRVRGGA